MVIITENILYENGLEFRGFIDMIEWISLHPYWTVGGIFAVAYLVFVVIAVYAKPPDDYPGV